MFKLIYDDIMSITVRTYNERPDIASLFSFGATLILAQMSICETSAKMAIHEWLQFLHKRFRSAKEQIS